MFSKGIYSLQVLLLHGNIIIGPPDKESILYSLKYTPYTNIYTSVTDTIGALCKGTTLQPETTEKEREQFLNWFTKNINNIKELHEQL